MEEDGVDPASPQHCLFQGYQETPAGQGQGPASPSSAAAASGTDEDEDDQEEGGQGETKPRAFEYNLDDYVSDDDML